MVRTETQERRMREQPALIPSEQFRLVTTDVRSRRSCRLFGWLQEFRSDFLGTKERAFRGQWADDFENDYDCEDNCGQIGQLREHGTGYHGKSYCNTCLRQHRPSQVFRDGRRSFDYTGTRPGAEDFSETAQDDVA